MELLKVLLSVWLAVGFAAADPTSTFDPEYLITKEHHEALMATPLPTAAISIPTKTMAFIGDRIFTMTAPTQTIDGDVYAVENLLKYKVYDPEIPAVHTEACFKDAETKGNKTLCKIERCMHKFLQPINITTVKAVHVHDNYGHHFTEYTTQFTQIHRPHWGTTNPSGVYYPVSKTLLMMPFNRTYGTMNHSMTTSNSLFMARQIPSHLQKDHTKTSSVHGDPPCYDADSCFNHCNRENVLFPDDDFDPKMLLAFAGLPLSALLTLAAILFCCCRNRRRRESVKEKLGVRKKPTETSTTTTTETVLAGTAAGAAAAQPADHANQTSTTGEGHTAASSDGRGTTSRRAEEGRGQVDFAQNPKPVPVDGAGSLRRRL